MEIQFLDNTHLLWREMLDLMRHDFYHLPQYFALEAQRIGAAAEAVLIRESDRVFFLPYLLRSCRSLFGENAAVPETFDAVSPNGYAGILLSSAADTDFLHRAMHQLMQAFHDRNICSVFVRLHPVLNDRFAELYPSEACQVHSETIAIDLTLEPAELWSQTRPEHRTKINRCKRSGFVAKQVSFHDRGGDFIEIYTQTMDRVEAKQFFYFSPDYFQQLAQALGEQLSLCIVELNGEAVSAGLFTECDGIVQYHLGGTKTAFLKQSPSVLMFDGMRDWAKARGNQVLHLGGGVGGAKDSLHHFKAGFSKRRHSLTLLRLIPRPALYDNLVELKAKSLNCPSAQLHQSSFFPAYRYAA